MGKENHEKAGQKDKAQYPPDNSLHANKLYKQIR
jgi:hypothetical protein